LKFYPLAQTSIFVFAIRDLQSLYLSEEQFILFFEIEVLIFEDALDGFVIVMNSLAEMGAIMFVVIGSGLGNNRAVWLLVSVDGPSAEFFGVDIREASGGCHRGQDSRLILHHLRVLLAAKEGLSGRWD
jgi:hypothetical protein